MTTVEKEVVDILLDQGPCDSLYMADELGRGIAEVHKAAYDMLAEGTVALVLFSEEIGYWYLPGYHSLSDTQDLLPDWFEGQFGNEPEKVIDHSDMGEQTITEKQARRFWAIALDTGYIRQGVHRLLQEYGYTEAEEIYKDHYDEMCAKAEDDEMAWQMNRDPDTRDMFA